MKYISQTKLEEFNKSMKNVEYCYKSLSLAMNRFKKSYEALPDDIKKKLK